MTPEHWFILVGGAFVTALNGAVAFFLRSIHEDFKRLLTRFELLDKNHSERLAVIEYELGMSTNPMHRLER